MLTDLAWIMPTLLALLLAHRGLHRLCGRAAGSGAAGRVLVAAEVFGTFLIAAAATQCVRGDDFATDARWVATFGITALLAFELAAWLGVRALAGGAMLRAVAEDNLAAAVLAGGHVIATGILAANLFTGTAWSELGLALGFFAISQVSLHVLVWLFRCLTTYDDTEQVLGHNLAAGVAHAGVSIGIALLVAHASDGPYVDLASSLGEYGLALAEGLTFYLVRQLLVPVVLLGAAPRLRGGALDDGIGRADLGAGAMEASVYVATALLLRSLG